MGKKDRRKDITEALKKVSEFILSLEGSLIDETDKITHPLGNSPWMRFSRQEDGGLELSGEEFNQYHECLNILVGAVDTDLISKKAIDKHLKGAILAAIDINKRRLGASFEDRAKVALETLKKELTNKPKLCQVYYRVSGLKPTFNPDHFGGVRFVVFDEHIFDTVKDTVKRNAKNEKVMKRFLIDTKKFTEEPLQGKTVAIVEVNAIDDDAARGQALKRLRLTIDVLNYYSDILYPPKSAYISVYGEDERTSETIPVFVPEEEQLYQHQKAFGRFQSFSMSDLIHGKGIELGATRVSEMLTKGNQSDIEGRLISALQCCGRASVDERSEEAFLLYAIALESLIMEKGNDIELGYRFRTRLAYLLGANPEGRLSIYSNVGKLYTIRSNIVHKGDFEVSDHHLGLIRFYAKASILQLLTQEPFTSMKTDEELLKWLNDTVLTGDIQPILPENEVGA